MAFTVVYDANVLYPAPLRELLVGLAQTGVVRACWTEEILNECFRNILAQRPDLNQTRLRRTRELMNRAVRDCLITGYERLVPALALPDPSDRHVLAAAVRAGAEAIVTFNLKDFPGASLRPFGIEAMHPDVFIQELMDISPEPVCAAVLDQVARLRNPPVPLPELLELFESRGLPASAARFRKLLVRP